jgi:flagellin-like hook-associated protein FlgL
MSAKRKAALAELAKASDDLRRQFSAAIKEAAETNDPERRAELQAEMDSLLDQLSEL